MRKKRNKKIRIFIVAIILLLVAAAVFLVIRYAPTKETMSGYEYFDIAAGGNGVAAIVDGDITKDAGVYDDGRLYLKQEFVEDNINVRFYYDKETGAVLYSTIDTTYVFVVNSSTYSDSDSKIYKTEAPVLKRIDDEYYLNFSFVAERTNCTYVASAEPNRVVITLDHSEKEVATVMKNDAVRYRAGVKSPILSELSVGTKVYCQEVVDDWTEVTTDTGFTGYIRTKNLSDKYNEVLDDSYTDNIAVRETEKKVCLSWFEVYNVNANDKVDSYLQNADSLNVISPTWYAITSENGDVSSLAKESLVENMHQRGIEVWPLINDFDKTLDMEALWDSRQARSNIITKLIGDAVQYNYDGLNLDMEYIKKESAPGFLQFVRELAQQCKANNIVLSIDNYTPANYRKYYNFYEQSVYADYIIIMGYDEHWNGSEAGSVSSINFTETGINNTLKQVPKEKVINAVPFYTRIWKESNGTTTGTAMSMQRAFDTAAANGAQLVWNDETQQYYAEYTIDGDVYKIWLEDENSLAKKFEVMKKAGIAGMASWSLGQEREAVWDAIAGFMN